MNGNYFQTNTVPKVSKFTKLGPWQYFNPIGTLMWNDCQRRLLALIILAAALFFCTVNSSPDSLASKKKTKSPNRNGLLEQTPLAFLDDLSETQSELDGISENRSKKYQNGLEPIPEEDEERFIVPESAFPVSSASPSEKNEFRRGLREEANEPLGPFKSRARHLADSKALRTKASGPTEEDRLIDDKLKFLIPYYEHYERLDGPNSPWRRALFVLGLVGLLVIFFYLMYTISSDYLTPSLAHLSAACKMSPDMAGLTFLAFGNGAPDLFTALLGAEDAPEMILGSSIGSGLFIFTVVFGAVILFARDPNGPQASMSASTLIMAFPSPKGGNDRVKIGRGTFWRNALMYAGCVGALAVFTARREIPFWQPLALMVGFFIYLATSILAHYLRPSKSRSGCGGDTNESKNVADDSDADGMQMLEIERLRFKLQQLPFLSRVRICIKEQSDWEGMNVFSRVFWCITVPIRLALNLTILPLPDPTLLSTPNKLIAHWYISRILLPINPLFSLALLGWLTGAGETLIRSAGLIWACVICLFCATFMSFILLLGSSMISNPLAGTVRSWKHSLPLWLATGYSFTCCIAWIYAVSNELVAALSALGLILGVSRTVMGCLVLAWGNSIGDLIADVALARNGAPQTAITAIFSGPVQNVLLTIGISFMTAAARSPEKLIKLAQLRKDIHLSLAMLIFVLAACTILIPGYFKYRIPRYFGTILIAVYVLYVPFGVWLGIQP